jgi:TPR repeat protein
VWWSKSKDDARVALHRIVTMLDSAQSSGGLYRDGLGGARDYVKAREWFQKAADASFSKSATL